MKSVVLSLFLIASILVGAGDISALKGKASNLTISEIESLPEGTTHEDIKNRLKYFTLPEVTIPMLSFTIEGETDKNCIMLFDQESETLKLAWIDSTSSEGDEEAIILWPQKFVGKKLCEVLK